MQSKAIVTLLFVAAPALAQDPVLTHQGRLLDGNGEPISSTVDLSISLYDTETSMPAEWSRQFANQPLQDGYYAVALVRDDNDIAIDPADFSDGEVWVQVLVDGAPMGSRTRLGDVPFAIQADMATTALSADQATSAQQADVASDLSVNHVYLSPSLGTPDWLDHAAFTVCASKHATMRYLEAPGSGQSCSSKCSDSENPGNSCLGGYATGGDLTPWATQNCSTVSTSLQWCCCSW